MMMTRTSLLRVVVSVRGAGCYAEHHDHVPAVACHRVHRSMVATPFCSTSYCLQVLREHVCSFNPPSGVQFTALWLANANSAVNVFIYSSTNKQFRRSATIECAQRHSNSPRIQAPSFNVRLCVCVCVCSPYENWRRTSVDLCRMQTVICEVIYRRLTLLTERERWGIDTLFANVLVVDQQTVQTRVCSAGVTALLFQTILVLSSLQ